jgi:hypothetical protein
MKGKTLTLSISVAAILGLVGLLGYWYWTGRTAPPSALTKPPAPRRITAPTLRPPAIRFTDITQKAGIYFVHTNGAYGEKLLPETMGSGVGFIDFDRDGDQDLIFVNFAPWLGHETNPLPTQAFYRNRGDGTFENITAQVGLDVTLYGMGVAVGDCNNDGYDDLVLTGLSGNRLYLNDQGKRFVEKTDAGLESAFGWSTSAAFLDYNKDGKLDLFICNYIRWTPELDRTQGFQLTGIGRAFGPPTNFEGAHSQLFRGNGDGTFVDVSESAGLRKFDHLGHPKGKALGVVTCDVDQDGWTDILVANDTVQNFFWHNLGNGTFEEIGEHSGIAYDESGQTRGAMGIDAADHRLAGALGVAIGNFANEATALYVTQDSRRLFFADEAIVAGISYPTRLMLTFGVLWVDYDLDCYPDLACANGHLEEEISKVNPTLTYRQRTQLFWNTGGRLPQDFVELLEQDVGEDFAKPIAGRGLASADIDNDGDLDLVVTSNGEAPLLLRNDGANQQNGWLRLRLEGDGQKVNRNGYGTKVTLVMKNGRRQVQELVGGRSYLSQPELVLTFGTGSDRTIPELIVEWLDGRKVILQDVPTQQTLTIRYGDEAAALAQTRR